MNVYVSKALSAIAIVVCGGAGAIAGFSAIRWLGIEGIAGALVAALVGMLVAVALWALGVAVLKALRWMP